MKEEYDPSKLFAVDAKARGGYYRSKDPMISVNTKTANMSFNKKAHESLNIGSVKKLKVRFLCDGFKLYIDSTIEANDSNYITISISHVANSRAICIQLMKHYNIKGDCRAIFNLVEVEKYRFRLDLKKTEPIKKKEAKNAD